MRKVAVSIRISKSGQAEVAERKDVSNLDSANYYMMARAGTGTKNRNMKSKFHEFKWCCKKKGCPFSLEPRRIYCGVALTGKKVECKCNRWPYKLH